MRVKVKVETRWHTGQLLWPQLIRVVYWRGCDGLGLSVVSIHEVVELDPTDLNSWDRAPRHAIVEFEVPQGQAFEVSAFYDPGNPDGPAGANPAGVNVTVE